MVAQGCKVTQQHRAWDCCQVLRSADCDKVREGGREEKSENQKQVFLLSDTMVAHTVSGGTGTVEGHYQVVLPKEEPSKGLGSRQGCCVGPCTWKRPC